MERVLAVRVRLPTIDVAQQGGLSAFFGTAAARLLVCYVPLARVYAHWSKAQAFVASGRSKRLVVAESCTAGGGELSCSVPAVNFLSCATACAAACPQRARSGAPSIMKHSPRRQHRKRRRRRWLTRCVLGLLVAAAAVLLVVHVRGDDDAARPPDEVRRERRSRIGEERLAAETSVRWLVAMRAQEERASEERRKIYRHP